jgi:hypothetical protein
MWQWTGPLDRLLRGEQTRSLMVLSGAALLLAVAGAVGSVGLMLRAGHRNDSLILLAIFAIWVVSPFVALILANLISKRWSVLTRVTLHVVMLIITIGSLANYANMVSAPPGSKIALPFLVVPLGSWLLITIVFPMAALLSRRLSRFRPVRWLIKVVAAVVMLSVIAITVLLGLLLLDHNRDTTLPAPTGPFAIGRTTYAWSDPARPEVFGPKFNPIPVKPGKPAQPNYDHVHGRVPNPDYDPNMQGALPHDYRKLICAARPTCHAKVTGDDVWSVVACCSLPTYRPRN